ncbi:MAG: FHA domain-containing protein [Synechococcales bacterium]|nr:FHA domain-containing protein [Synechococcales bacterium]
MTTIIEPVLKAHKRCQVTSFYIQAVSIGRTAFLTTNLASEDSTNDIYVTSAASSWLIGRSSGCAVALGDRSASRRHAVIGHHPHDGFFIADVGSRNGTWVNRKRLSVRQRRILNDGDLLQLGNIRIEFFVVNRSLSDLNSDHVPVYLATSPIGE